MNSRAPLANPSDGHGTLVRTRVRDAGRRPIRSPLLALAAAAFSLTGAAPAQETYVKAPNADAGDLFGNTLVLSGDTLVVSALEESSGSTGVAGDPSDNSRANSGAVYVLVRNGAGWTQQAYLKASNTDSDDRFGVSADLDGDTLVVGAYLEKGGGSGVDSDQSDNSVQGAGAAYVFVRNAGTWSQQAYLKATHTDINDRFGISVAIDGDTILVGSINESSDGSGPADNSVDDAGAAYVFVRNGTTWTQQAMLKANVTGDGDRFGIAVDVDGDRAAIGAYYEDSATTGVNGDASNDAAVDAGAAYVFERSGTTWTQQAYIKAANADADDNFGFPLHLEGDRLVVGARSEDGGSPGVNGDATDDSAPDAGAVYVFDRGPGGWSQSAYIKASNVDASDRFGYGLDLSGDTMVVGAHWEQSASTGVDGDANDDSLDKAGAAYVFAFKAGTWVERTYVKAEHPDSLDLFGRYVTIDGDVIAVGARAEDGSALGDGSDDALSAAGAAYVFELDYWSEYPGCHGNAASIARPMGAARVGDSVALVIDGGPVVDGLVATFRGVLGVDAGGCGVVLAPAEEALVAFAPTPTSIGIAALTGGKATQPFGVPTSPALVGLDVTVQSVAIDTTTFASAFTGAVEFRIQP